MTVTDSHIIDRLTELQIGLQINRGQPPGSTIEVNAACFILCYDNNSHKAEMSPERQHLYRFSVPSVCILTKS